MKKLLLLILLFPLFCFSQDHEQYIPTIAWSTNIDNVVFINTDTFTVDVLPLDLSEPGAFPLRNGNYLADNRGLRYLIIDTTAYPTLTVVDIFKEGFAPFQGKIGYVYQSAGGGKSHSLPTIMFEKLDPKAFDYGYRLDMNILWGQLGQPFDTVALNIEYVETGDESVGVRYWNPDDNTTNLVLPNGVVLQDGHELFFDVLNQTGSELTNGYVAAYGGVLGASAKITAIYGIADGSMLPEAIIGIFTESITNGEQGKVTWFGKVRGIITDGSLFSESWSDSDTLWVSPYTSGYLTNVKPNAPFPAIFMAVVAFAHSSNGTLIVRPSFPESMTSLSDVNGTPLTISGQFPVWDNDSSFFDFIYNINDYLRIEDAPEFATLLEATTGINDSTIISPLTNAGVNELINVPYYGAKENIITDYNITADSTFVNRLEIGDDNVVRRISYPLSGLSAVQQSLNLIVDGVDVYMETENVDGGNIAYVFDEERHILDCTTGDGVGGMAQVQLTVGTATAPQINYIYVVPNGTGVATLMASTSLPTDTFAWHSVVVLQDITTISTHGAIALQRMTEALKHNGRGQLSYMREKLRWLGAEHVSGATSTITSTNPLDVLVSSGEIFQLHRQVFPTLNVGVDGITVANASGAGTLTKFENIHDLNDIAELADGSSIGNAKYASVTIWATMASSDQTGNQSKLFVNLPIGFYGSESEAIADANNYDVRTVDSEFQTTAFLVSRVVFKRLGGLNVPVGDGVYSLTGLPLGSIGGGAGSTALTEFNDAVFHIYNNADPTKILDYDLSLITTGNTRTFNVPDYDINFGGLVIDGSDSLVNGNTVYDYIVPISALITANLDSINLFRPLIDANTGKDTTGIYHANRTALDLVEGTNTGDQDISGIATNASDISDLQDTVAIHLDTLQAHNSRINQNTSDIAAIPTTEEQTATLLEAQTGINDSAFITPATLMAAIELNSIQSYGEEEHLHMPNRNITGDTLFGYITITESQISDLTHFVNADETDQVYVASEAFNIGTTDITNLGNLSGTNTGDQDISGIATNTQAIKDTASQIRIDFPDASLWSDSGTDIYSNDDENIRIGNGTTTDKMLTWQVGTSSDANTDFRFVAESAGDLVLQKKQTGAWTDYISFNYAGAYFKLSHASSAHINQFSTDGTLAANSNLSVPTEKAVKTYVDAQSSGMTDPMTTIGDIIYRNSSNVTDRLGIGTQNYLLVSDGSIPVYRDFSSAITSGTVSASFDIVPTDKIIIQDVSVGTNYVESTLARFPFGNNTSPSIVTTAVAKQVTAETVVIVTNSGASVLFPTGSNLWDGRTVTISNSSAGGITSSSYNALSGSSSTTIPANSSATLLYSTSQTIWYQIH